MDPPSYLPLPLASHLPVLGSGALFTAVYASAGHLFRITPLSQGALFGALAFIIGRISFSIFQYIGREFALLLGIRGREQMRFVFSLLHRVFYFSTAGLLCLLSGFPFTPEQIVALALVGQVVWFLMQKIYRITLRMFAFWYGENFQLREHKA